MLSEVAAREGEARSPSATPGAAAPRGPGKTQGRRASRFRAGGLQLAGVQAFMSRVEMGQGCPPAAPREGVDVPQHTAANNPGQSPSPPVTQTAEAHF